MTLSYLLDVTLQKVNDEMPGSGRKWWSLYYNDTFASFSEGQKNPLDRGRIGRIAMKH